MPTENWIHNPARAIIRSDLEEGRLPLSEEEMAADEAYNQFYKDNSYIQAVAFKKFKEKLKYHRGQLKRSMEKQPSEPSKPKFRWEKSEAKCVLLEDLCRGVLSLEADAKDPEAKWNSYYKTLENGLNEENELELFEALKKKLQKEAMTAKQAWEQHYKKLPAFSEVSYIKFRTNLNSLRKQVKAGKKRSMEEERMWREDLKRYPPKTKKADGKPLWDCHPAKDLLRADVAERKNKVMTPAQLYETSAANCEYKDFALSEFRHRIYQENCRWRFCNYLNDKRETEKNIHCCKPPLGTDDNTLVDCLNALGLDDSPTTEDQQMDVDDVSEWQRDVTRGPGTCKRQVHETFASNKKQKL